MTAISTLDLVERLNWRYAVKKFDPTRRLDDQTWRALQESMLLSPSSYGLQPWKFVVVTNQEVKNKLPELSWNQTQPKDCSHMVVLAARKSIDADYVDHYMQSVVEQRELPQGAMDGYRKVLVSTVEKMDDHLDWNARQVYIALGQLMVACSMVGVDSCPMEGIDTNAYDELLGLKDSDFTTIVGCAVGYRHPADVQANARKVRFDAKEIVQLV